MAKKFFKRALIGALLLSALLTLLLFLTDNAYIIKGVSHTYLRGKKSPGITDHALFDVRTVEATSPRALPLHSEYNQKELTDRLSAELAKWNSVAFLVFLRDSLIHEQYWDGFSADSRTNTYSASKTVVTLAAQKAIEQGLIQGWDQKAKDYLPELKGAYADQLSLRHLSTMTAGLDWDEHYSSPFTITAKTYYTDRLEEVMLGVEIAEPPGKRHHYQSGSTQLLALCVMRHGEKPFGICVGIFLGATWGRKRCGLAPGSRGRHRDRILLYEHECTGLRALRYAGQSPRELAWRADHRLCILSTGNDSAPIRFLRTLLLGLRRPTWHHGFLYEGEGRTIRDQYSREGAGHCTFGTSI